VERQKDKEKPVRERKARPSSMMRVIACPTCRIKPPLHRDDCTERRENG